MFEEMAAAPQPAKQSLLCARIAVPIIPLASHALGAAVLYQQCLGRHHVTAGGVAPKLPFPAASPLGLDVAIKRRW